VPPPPLRQPFFLCPCCRIQAFCTAHVRLTSLGNSSQAMHRTLANLVSATPHCAAPGAVAVDITQLCMASAPTAWSPNKSAIPKRVYRDSDCTSGASAAAVQCAGGGPSSAVSGTVSRQGNAASSDIDPNDPFSDGAPKWCHHWPPVPLTYSSGSSLSASSTSPPRSARVQEALAACSSALTAYDAPPPMAPSARAPHVSLEPASMYIDREAGGSDEVVEDVELLVRIGACGPEPYYQHALERMASCAIGAGAQLHVSVDDVASSQSTATDKYMTALRQSTPHGKMMNKSPFGISTPRSFARNSHDSRFYWP
jgi:hypothetical protein